MTIDERAKEYARSSNHEAVCKGCQYWRSLGYVKGSEEQIEIDKNKISAFWETEFLSAMPDEDKGWAQEKLQELLDELDK